MLVPEENQNLLGTSPQQENLYEYVLWSFKVDLVNAFHKVHCGRSVYTFFSVYIQG